MNTASLSPSPTTHEFQRVTAAPRESFARHPLVENLALLTRDGYEYKRISDSIKTEGIIEPLKCVASGNTLLVLDGIHRLQIAEDLDLPELPYRLVKKENILAVICGSAIRAGWSKSALAYRMWPIFETLSQNGAGRPKKGNDFPILSSSEIGEKLGVSEKLIDQAKAAHKYFSGNPKAREEIEPYLLAGVFPLHKVGKSEDDSSKSSPSAAPAVVIAKNLKALPKAFADYHKMDGDSRQRSRISLIETLLLLPDEVQKAAFEALDVKLHP